MFELDVTTDNQSGIAGMISGLTAQLPFAYAVAINDTVNQSQTAIQRSLPADFTLRRPAFIIDSVYRKPGQDFATKDNLAGVVRINPLRDELAKFENDTTKTSRTGKALAIPIVRLDAPGLILQRTDPLYIKNVMTAISSNGVLFKRQRRGKGAAYGPLPAKADKNTVFLAKSHSGKTLVIQRTGPSTTRVLYEFVPSVPIDTHRLRFEEIAMQVALERWEPNWERALAFAIATMR